MMAAAAVGGHALRRVPGAGHHTEHVDAHDALEVREIVVEKPPVHGARYAGPVQLPRRGSNPLPPVITALAENENGNTIKRGKSEEAHVQPTTSAQR